MPRLRRVAEKRLSAATSSGACRRSGALAPAGVYSSVAAPPRVCTCVTRAPVMICTPGVRAATA